MPHPRPLVIALAIVVAAGLCPSPSLAAKKSVANKSKTPAVALACSDFYADANRAWLSAHPAPKSGAVSALGQLTANAEQQQRDLLDAAMRAPQDNVGKLLGDFWASGLDIAAVEKDGAAPVAPLLQRIDAIRSSKDIAPAIAALHQVGIPVAFHFGADVDLRDLNRHLGYFAQGGIGLPDPAYYTRTDADTKALVARYADYIRKILALTGVAKQDIETQTALALDLESRIARAAKPLVELRDPRNNFTPVPVAGLGKQYRNLQLDAFLKAQGINDEDVSIANPALFTQLDTLVGKLKPAQWQAYLRWRIGDAMAPYLSAPWREAAFEFRGKVLLGQTEPAPRWQQVLDAINLAAGPMLGKAYATAYLPDATRAQAEQIAEQVREALLLQVAASPQLDVASKAEAAKKLAQLRVEVGTPRRDLDYTLQPMGRGSFGSNMLIASTWRHAQEMKRIGKGNADRRWDVLPQQPSLSYDMAHNRLIVTAAMLQTPVLDMKQPLAQQYGSFGALAGHELSHAVDARGRHVDAAGNVRDWWSPDTAASWTRLTGKVSALYANLPYPGVPGAKLQGSLTQDENLADLAGLELARAAYLTAQPKPSNVQDRQFYTGWAQLWAQQVAPEEAQIRMQQDVRAPGQWRANVPLMQQPAFGAAFGCKTGSPMQAAVEARVTVF
ncbi:MAG: M13 family metallopeptidase [Xanthomonadaceae bacterium]|nr:M13 family metallopeptidase [Xanthomonadaceae bacterium]